MTRLLTALILLVISLPAWAESSAVILMYHRFGEPQHSATNIQMDVFESHLKYIRDNGFRVLPVPKIIDTLKKGGTLPDKTVGITIDDAYMSVYTRAWPLLKRYDYPFTLFVATDAIDRRFTDYMSWNDLRRLQDDENVTIASQGDRHIRMITAGGANNRRDVSKSLERLEAELDQKVTLFAYPYGEYSNDTKKLIQDFGFKAAFGQQSGALFSGSDFYGLPRFAMNEEYGNIERFKMAINALPLPVRDVVPGNTVVPSRFNPPAFGFTIDTSITDATNIACYAGPLGKVDVLTLSPERVEVRLPEKFKSTRNRINCTKNAGGGRWRWFSQPVFYID